MSQSRIDYSVCATFRVGLLWGATSKMMAINKFVSKLCTSIHNFESQYFNSEAYPDVGGGGHEIKKTEHNPGRRGGGASRWRNFTVNFQEKFDMLKRLYFDYLQILTRFFEKTLTLTFTK